MNLYLFFNKRQRIILFTVGIETNQHSDCAPMSNA